MTRAPTTLHEHFRADPRGADSFSKWIEDRIWELLQRPCRAHEVIGLSYSAKYDFSSAANAVKWCMWRRETLHGRYQVVLLDGTIIKEWAALEATTDRASKVADWVGG